MPCTIGHFAMNKEFFEEIGVFDEEMSLWGGENVDVSIRVSASRIHSLSWMAKPTVHSFFRHSKRFTASLFVHFWHKSFAGLLKRNRNTVKYAIWLKSLFLRWQNNDNKNNDKRCLGSFFCRGEIRESNCTQISFRYCITRHYSLSYNGQHLFNQNISGYSFILLVNLHFRLCCGVVE